MTATTSSPDWAETTYEIARLTIHGSHPDGWDDIEYDGDKNDGVQLPKPGGGSDAGCVMVRLRVDGMWDAVYANVAHAGDVSTIDAAIATLTRTRTALVGLYQGRVPRDYCIETNGSKGCLKRPGHGPDHEYPDDEVVRS